MTNKEKADYQRAAISWGEENNHYGLFLASTSEEFTSPSYNSKHSNELCDVVAYRNADDQEKLIMARLCFCHHANSSDPAFKNGMDIRKHDSTRCHYKKQSANGISKFQLNCECGHAAEAAQTRTMQNEPTSDESRRRVMTTPPLTLSIHKSTRTKPDDSSCDGSLKTPPMPRFKELSHQNNPNVYLTSPQTKLYQLLGESRIKKRPSTSLRRVPNQSCVSDSPNLRISHPTHREQPLPLTSTWQHSKTTRQHTVYGGEIRPTRHYKSYQHSGDLVTPKSEPTTDYIALDSSQRLDARPAEQSETGFVQPLYPPRVQDVTCQINEKPQIYLDVLPNESSEDRPEPSCAISYQYQSI